jgi:hypothetical protein
MAKKLTFFKNGGKFCGLSGYVDEVAIVTVKTTCLTCL